MLLAHLAGAGCARDREANEQATATPGSASSSASRAAASAPPPADSHGHAGAAEVTGCRALSLSGSVTKLNGGAPIAAGALITGGDWLELADGARVSLRHVTTAREWTLSGPGRVRPCREGDEQIALARGTLQAGAGAGVRPGAEVLLVTPLGTVRYGDASLKLVLEEDRLTVTLSNGEAWFDPASDRKLGPARLGTGRPKVVVDRPNRALLERRCEELAQAASKLAAVLAAKDSSTRERLPEAAVEHLKARRAARRACTAFEAYAARLEGDERGRLLDRSATLDRLWKALPSSRPAGNP